jgi:hypothetical protein
MPLSLSDQKAANGVTSGEILVGAAWLILYGALIFGSLSRNSEELVAAVNLSGLW